MNSKEGRYHSKVGVKKDPDDIADGDIYNLARFFVGKYDLHSAIDLWIGNKKFKNVLCALVWMENQKGKQLNAISSGRKWQHHRLKVIMADTQASKLPNHFCSVEDIREEFESERQMRERKIIVVGGWIRNSRLRHAQLYWARTMVLQYLKILVPSLTQTALNNNYNNNNNNNDNADNDKSKENQNLLGV